MSSLKPRVQCSHCSYAFYHTAALSLHSRKHRWTQQSREDYRNSVARARQICAVSTARLKVMSNAGESSKVACSKCNVDFMHDTLLKQHIQRQHARQIVCQTCTQVFSTKRLMRTHFAAKHCDSRQMFAIRKRMYCDICSRVFLHLGSFSRHVATCQQGA